MLPLTIEGSVNPVNGQGVVARNLRPRFQQRLWRDHFRLPCQATHLRESVPFDAISGDNYELPLTAISPYP